MGESFRKLDRYYRSRYLECFSNVTLDQPVEAISGMLSARLTGQRQIDQSGLDRPMGANWFYKW